MNAAASIAQTLANAARALHVYSDSPRLDAELLLGKVLGLSRSSLIAHDERLLDARDESAYADLIRQRARGMPVAYLTGCREFWSLPLIVTPNVLVPRPETESLVQHALQVMPPEAAVSVLDLGTGSGAIALSLASERPCWNVAAVDLSAQALEVAMQNSAALGLARIKWRLGDWFGAVPGERFHLIVGNPPYIAEGDPVLASLAAEPAMALTAGPTGLDALSVIIAQAPLHIHPRGWLMLEHGATQAPAVAELMAQHGFTSVRTHLDFSGKPRITLGTHTHH
jgi:release factor glutamine methyltransferase